MDLTSQVCLECGYEDGPVDVMSYGVFPISLKTYIYISFENLDLISTMKNFNPLLSNASVTNHLTSSQQRGSWLSSHDLKAPMLW